MSGLPGEVLQLTAHTDLTERLALVPPSARIRGLYFNNVKGVLRSAAKLPDYEMFSKDYSSLRWYPLSDYLVFLATGGALLKSPEEVHQGMYEIGRHNALAFADSLLGKVMLRLLSRDPVRLLRQASAGRRQSCQYGRWEAEIVSPGHGVMHMWEEYLWIESHVAGAAKGTFETIGVDVEVRCELDSPFQGRNVLLW